MYHPFQTRLQLAVAVTYVFFIPHAVTTDGWNFSGKDGEDIVGHIVMAGFRFYQLCRKDLRKNWLLAYEKSDFKCLT